MGFSTHDLEKTGDKLAKKSKQKMNLNYSTPSYHNSSTKNGSKRCLSLLVLRFALSNGSLRRCVQKVNGIRTFTERVQ